MLALARRPTLRQNVAVSAKANAIGEGCGTLRARSGKPQVGNLNDRYFAFLVEARHGKSREPQNLLHFGEAFGNLDKRIRRCIGEFVYRDCQTDRKSTRLNSSHLVISYAVFCLKKKKK